MYECMSPIVAIDVLKDYACESSKRCGAVGGATVSGPVHIRNVRTYVTCMYVGYRWPCSSSEVHAE